MNLSFLEITGNNQEQTSLTKSERGERRNFVSYSYNSSTNLKTIVNDDIYNTQITNS